MELAEAIKQVEVPRNPYDKDLIALRVLAMDLFNRVKELEEKINAPVKASKKKTEE